MEIERQIPVQLSARLYFALSSRLTHTNDKRTVHEIASLAVKQWLGEIGEKNRLSGYQWGPLFLPDGSEVRLRYKRGNYIARVIGDALMYEGLAMTPREFGIAVTGSVQRLARRLDPSRTAGRLDQGRNLQGRMCAFSYSPIRRTQKTAPALPRLKSEAFARRFEAKRGNGSGGSTPHPYISVT